MHRSIGPAVLALGIAGSMATFPGVVEAQAHDWTISPRAGITLPINDLGRLQKAGLGVGLGVERVVERTARRQPMWSVRVDLGLDRLPGAESNGTTFPRMSLYRYTLGVDYWATRNPRSAFSARVKGGVGGTTMRTSLQPDGLDVNETILTIFGGLAGGFKIFYADAEWTMLFAGPRFTGRFPVRGSFRNLMLVRLGAGVRIGL